MATRKVPYTDARGVRRWVEVEADAAQALDTYDRWARRREKRFRRTHLLECDLEAMRAAARQRRNRPRAKLVGYLNFELEPAARAAKLHADDGYPWEGARPTFSLLMGESPTWSGPLGLVEFRELEDVDGEKVEVTKLYGVEWDGSQPCRLCGSIAELPEYAACLHCCRTGRDHEIGAGAARRRDRIESSNLKGGVGR
jgi:hypothetical protein